MFGSALILVLILLNCWLSSLVSLLRYNIAQFSSHFGILFYKKSNQLGILFRSAWSLNYLCHGNHLFHFMFVLVYVVINHVHYTLIDGSSALKLDLVNWMCNEKKGQWILLYCSSNHVFACWIMVKLRFNWPICDGAF